MSILNSSSCSLAVQHLGSGAAQLSPVVVSHSIHINQTLTVLQRLKVMLASILVDLWRRAIICSLSKYVKMLNFTNLTVVITQTEGIPLNNVGNVEYKP